MTLQTRFSKVLALLSLLLLFTVAPVRGAEDDTLLFRASDKSFTLSTEDEFRVAYNAHAILSLASLDDIAVVVTKRKATETLDKLYDLFPKSMPADYPISGRMMLTIDGEQSAAFVLDGMFPPQGEPTHQTLIALVVRDGQEYNFMIHYPLEMKEKGLERAYALLSAIKWTPGEAVVTPEPEAAPSKTKDKTSLKPSEKS